MYNILISFRRQADLINSILINILIKDSELSHALEIVESAYNMGVDAFIVQDHGFASLLKKETLCIFRSPTDIFEYFLFTLLMPFIVFTYDQLLTTITVNQAGINMIAGAHVMVVAILAMLSNIVSASAISR